MITREELRSIPALHRNITRMKEQLYYLEEKATSIPSGLSESERVQSSPENKAGRYIDAAADLAREIRREEVKLHFLQTCAASIIDTVRDPLAQRILRYRYLNCFTWEEVADLVGYTTRHVTRIEYETLTNVLTLPCESDV